MESGNGVVSAAPGIPSQRPQRLTVSRSVQHDFLYNSLGGTRILMTRATTVMAIAAMTCFLGCNQESTGTVTGRILIDGEPTGGFEIHYVSQSDGTVGIGYAQADGSYRIYRGRGSQELRPGEYKVTVIPTPDVDGVPQPKVRFPKSYTDQGQSEIVKSVGPRANVIDIELNSGI